MGIGCFFFFSFGFSSPGLRLVLGGRFFLKSGAEDRLSFPLFSYRDIVPVPILGVARFRFQAWSSFPVGRASNGQMVSSTALADWLLRAGMRFVG